MLFGPVAEIDDEDGDRYGEEREWSGQQDDRDGGVHALRIRDSPACHRAQLRSVSPPHPVLIGARLGMHASVVGRVLRRHHAPLLRDLDPVTGVVIKATRRSANRYEHAHPGSLIHIDVKKLGRIPDGGGWRAHGRSENVRGRGIGYDYVHTAIDDHSRVAYAETHDDEKGVTAAGFLERAIAFYASLGVKGDKPVITYCRIGERSSHTWFALNKILGYKVKNYDGSWTEYGNSVGAPISNPAGTVWAAK